MSKTNEIESLFKKESIASGIINTFGAFMTFFYLNVIDPAPTAEKSIRELDPLASFVFIAIFASCFAAGIRWGNTHKRNFTTWYRLLETGEKSPAEIPRKIKRDVLNFPVYAAGIAALMWTSASIIATYFTSSWRVFIGLFGWGGLIAVILLYFVDDLLWRPLVPVFFPDGNVRHVRAFHMPIFGKLLLVFLFTGVLPPTLLVNLTWQRARTLLLAPNPEMVLQNLQVLQVFILGTNVLISIGLAFFITRGITKPLESLRHAMERVQRDDLDAKIVVTSNDELGFLSEGFNQMTAGLRQGEQLRGLFNVYVSPEVARAAIETGAGLGGELVTCTVLFSDIRGFTSLTEKMPPVTLVELINRYMTAMIEIITRHGGVVTRFGGDSILAVFGTPLNPIERHESVAVETARDMRAALKTFNALQVELQQPELENGVGIATGRVVCGNVGGEARLEYTVMGDAANLAARLQDLTKEYARPILISENTYQAIRGTSRFKVEAILGAHIKGKELPTNIYALV